MVTQTNCPPPDVIRSLLRGDLPDTSQAQMAAHLELCEDCRQRFESEAAGPEFLADVTRQYTASRDRADTASLRALLETLPLQLCRASDAASVNDWSEEAVRQLLDQSEIDEHLGRLGEYEIVEIVGRGGMGIVLHGVDPKLNRVVAVKVLAPELASNPNARRRFFREAQAAAAVSHDNVVTIHAVHDDDRLPYLVMEYIKGESLEELIRREGSLPVEMILRMGHQMAKGLAAAHRVGLVHRDMKPANILLENGIQKVCITDFGLARAVDDVGITRSGVVSGTPLYMSPEQAEGGVVDPRSDLFSVGSVLYTMCTGRPAFRADSTLAVLRRVCEDNPKPIRKVNQNIPEWMTDIVNCLMLKNRDNRIQSADDLSVVFEGHLAHIQDPDNVAPPESLSASASKGPTNRNQRWLLFCLMLLISVFSITEAAGVTSVVEYLGIVFKLKTPHGTLVVEIDDPDVKVAVDGDEVIVSGIGKHEIRLTPGQHDVSTNRSGYLSESSSVTIERGGKQVLRIRQLPPERPVEDAEPQLSAASLRTRIAEAELRANSTTIIDYANKELEFAQQELATALQKNKLAENPLFSQETMRDLKLKVVRAEAELAKAREDKKLAELTVSILRATATAGTQNSRERLLAELALAQAKAESDVIIRFAKEHLAVAEAKLQDRIRMNQVASSQNKSPVFTDSEIRKLELQVARAEAELAKAKEDQRLAALTVEAKQADLKAYDAETKPPENQIEQATQPSPKSRHSQSYVVEAAKDAGGPESVIFDNEEEEQVTHPSYDGIVFTQPHQVHRLRSGSRFHGPGGFHQFITVPEQLWGQRCVSSLDHQGVLEFQVCRRATSDAAQRIWLLVCETDRLYNSEEFKIKFDDHKSLLESGWQQSASKLSQQVCPEVSRHEWAVYYRDVNPGESYKIRTNADRSALLVWGSIDLGGLVVEPQWDQRIAEFNPGAHLPRGNGQLTFDEVPEILEGRLYTRRNGYAGITRFGVARNQTVLVGFYDWDHMQDGNPSGGWQQQVTTKQQLIRNGWTELITLQGWESNALVSAKTLHVYARDCEAGEVFALRNHKYQAPVIFSEQIFRNDAPTGAKEARRNNAVNVPRGKLDPGTLLGRAAVNGVDAGVIFQYHHGRFFDRSHLPQTFQEKQFTVALGGIIDLPRTMSITIYQAGGGVSHDVNRLFIDGREVGSTGDDRSKHFELVRILKAGRHRIRWELTGGTFRSNVLVFLDTTTKALIPLENDGLESLKLDDQDKVIPVAGTRKDWPIPDDWLPKTAVKLRNEPLNPAIENLIPDDLLVEQGTLAPPATKEEALAMIARLGGKAEVYDDQAVTKIILNNTDIADEDLALVRSFPRLRSLDLGRTGIGNDGLAHLSGVKTLEELDLYQTNVNDEGLQHLNQLTKLKWLMLKRTFVQLTGVAKLRLLLPDCQISFSSRNPDTE